MARGRRPSTCADRNQSTQIDDGPEYGSGGRSTHQPHSRPWRCCREVVVEANSMGDERRGEASGFSHYLPLAAPSFCSSLRKLPVRPWRRAIRGFQGARLSFYSTAMDRIPKSALIWGGSVGGARGARDPRNLCCRSVEADECGRGR
jgi:hypothetical protein